MSSSRRWSNARCSVRRVFGCPSRRADALRCGPFAQLGFETQLLNFPRQRVAAPAEPCRRFHPMPTGVRQRAADQRLFEFLLQTIADVALAADERLCELAVQCLLPRYFADGRADADDLAYFGGKVGDFDPLS